MSSLHFAEEIPPIHGIRDTANILLTFGIINGLFITGTLIGCLFFLYLFYLERKHRKIAHNYVISMCCGDIVHVGLGCSMVIVICTGMKLSDDLCPVINCLLMISVYVSLFTLTSAAVDRYMAVCHPLVYQTKMTHKMSYGIISVAWILGVLAGIPLYFMRSEFRAMSKPNELCLYISWVYEIKYLYGYLVLIMFICVVIMCILYAKIFLVLRKMFRAKLGPTTGLRSILTWIRAQNKEENAVIGLLKVREVQATCIMFATVVSFVLCWIPCMVIFIFNKHRLNEITAGILVSYCFPKIYSMINPVFYAYAIKNVRQSFNRNVRKMLGLSSKVKTKEMETLRETI